MKKEKKRKKKRLEKYFNDILLFMSVGNYQIVVHIEWNEIVIIDNQVI